MLVFVNLFWSDIKNVHILNIFCILCFVSAKMPYVLISHLNITNAFWKVPVFNSHSNIDILSSALTCSEPFWQNNQFFHTGYFRANILILRPIANSQELIVPPRALERDVCVFSSGSCTAVSVLPGSDRHRHVPTQQQQPFPQLPSKSSAWVPVQGPHCVFVHRWPTAVPLHKGYKPNYTIRY